MADRSFAQSEHEQEALARPPIVSLQRGPRVVLQQYLRLIGVFLAEYRAYWFEQVFLGMMLPLGLIFFLTLVDQQMTSARAVFLLGGNLTMSIAYGPTTMLISRLGWGRQNHEFDYWASLPIPKLALLLALVTVYFLFALPGICVTYIVGSVLLGFPLLRGLTLLPLLPLGALSLTGFGAFLGVSAKNGETANALGNVFIGIVTFLSPMLVPSQSMPVFLRFLAWCIPTTYLADTFRSLLSGNLGANLLPNIVILLCSSLFFLGIVHYRLDWRSAH
ncbi:MAG TPA: ABC transporter permease [Ktedonobacteraceae bacterium]|nr:ABC transporter permease [Ktedonobacteraceae bacterium]